MWSVISDPNGGYVQGINQGNAQGTIQLQDTNMTMRNINTMQGIAQSSVQGLVQQPQQQQQQPQIVDNLQGTTQGTMGNAQGIIFQQNGHSQGIGQPLLPNMTYIQGNPQHAGAGAGMGDCQQLFQQIKQMSASNPMMLMALQEWENRMLTNMTPVQNMTGVSPGYNCQGLMYNSNVQTQGIQVQSQGMQLVQPQGMSQFQQLGQNQVQVQQMVQPQVQQMVQPVVQPIMQQLVQQPFVQQGAIQPSLSQLGVQQPVMQPAVQPVVQQQPMVQQVVQPTVQLPVQPLVVQQPVTQQPVLQQVAQQPAQQPLQQHVVQQPVLQPVQQHAVQQFVQQPAIQQPALQQVVQQPIVQQPIHQQVVQLQQPTQPVVQQHFQLTPVSDQVMPGKSQNQINQYQGILPEQNKVMSQCSYQGILQVCNQGIPDVPSEGILQCPYQVTQLSQNQGLQLESQDAEMQPVHNQDYLGMALALIKSNFQLPQSRQEDPGVPQQIPEVKSSLCQPNADHSENQLDEGYQTDKLCGQHGTEVGGHEKPEYQGQNGNDNTQLVQVTVPVSDYEMLLMTEVPEQTWVPLLPSLPPQSNEDQSLPIQTTGTSLHMVQDSDYHFYNGEVRRDDVNSAHEDSSTPDTSELGDVMQADLIYSGLPTRAQQKIEGHHATSDFLLSADIDHETNTCLEPPVTQPTDHKFCQQRETIQECNPLPVSYLNELSIEIPDAPGNNFQPPIQGMEASDTGTSATHISNRWHINPGLYGYNQIYTQKSHNACWEYLVTETKFKPPDRNFGRTQIQEADDWCRFLFQSREQYNSRQNLHNTNRMFLVAETKHKPPDKPLCLLMESTNSAGLVKTIL